MEIALAIPIQGFNPNKGWLSRFKNRYSINFKSEKNENEEKNEEEEETEEDTEEDTEEENEEENAAVDDFMHQSSSNIVGSSGVNIDLSSNKKNFYIFKQKIKEIRLKPLRLKPSVQMKS